MSGIISDNVGRASGLVKAAGGGGKVGQVVTFTQRAVQSLTSHNAFTNAIPNFASSITPVATSSKILVQITGVFGDNNWCQLALASKITSGGTYLLGCTGGLAIASATGGGSRLAGTIGSFYSRGHHDAAQNFAITYLDSPATVSEMFYTMYLASSSNHTVYLNRSFNDGNYASIGRQISTIILSEILV